MIFASILNLSEQILAVIKCYGHRESQSGFAFKDAAISFHFSIRLCKALLQWSEKCCIKLNSVFQSVTFHLRTKHLLLLILTIKGVSISVFWKIWFPHVLNFLIWFQCPVKALISNVLIQFGKKKRKMLWNTPIANKSVVLLLRRM